MVCFFSVFTHLRHEESYTYLREAHRVLRVGGKAVFSFLEFAVDSHWAVFEQEVEDLNSDRPLNQFVSCDAVAAWAKHLGFEVYSVFPGDIPYIKLSRPVTMHGQSFAEIGTFGQSTAVLVR